MDVQHPRVSGVALIGTLMLILMAALAACVRPGPAPAPIPAPVERTATAAVMTPTSVPSPTPSPEPSPTAQPLPPVVVDVRPEPGEEAPPDTPIEVVFSMPVDPESAAAALQVSPEVPGDVEVVGPMLRFRPAEPFPRARWVTVRVREQVKGVNGLPLLRPVSYRFITQGVLEVTRHSPRDKETHVSVHPTIQMAFNRPMVSVDLTNQPLDPPAWLRFEPEVSGTVRWVGTSLLEFTPDAPLRADTTYTVTVSTPLEALDGAPLTEPLTFTFHTEAPRVLSIVGSYAGHGVGHTASFWPTRPFTVTFNMPMDPDSVAAHLRLVNLASREPVPVDLTWPWPDRVQITPREPLALGTAYRVEVDAGALAADGITPLRHSAKQLLHIVPRIGFRGSRPADGMRNVHPDMRGVRVYFYGLVDPESLAGNIAILPEPTSVFTYFNGYYNQLWIGFDTTARTTYTVTLGAGIADIFGNTLGEDVQIRFTTGDYPSAYRLGLPAGAAMFDAYRPVTVTLRGRNVVSATLSLYRPTPERVLGLIRMDPWRLRNINRSKVGEHIRTWELAFPQERNRWHRLAVPLRDDSGQSLPPGVYILQVEIRATGRQPFKEQRLLIISPYNLVLKTDWKQVLVWVTDLRTGQPVPDVPVQVLGPESSEIAVTDDDGLARVPVSRQDLGQPVVAITHPDAPDGVVSTRWQGGISPWDFRLSVGYRGPGGLVAYFQTERPVYRPGQTVHWKVIVRRDNDGVYELPAPGESVRLVIRDPNWEVVYGDTLALNEMGTASGDLPLAEDAPLGFYAIDVQGARMLERPTLLVAAYRKPEFEITVRAEPPQVLVGDTVRVTAEARYFFGAPVANARVEYVVRDEPFYFRWQCPEGRCPPYSFNERDWWRWEPFRPTGQPLARGSGRTDAEGQFVLTLPTALKEGQGSRRWTVEITVFDVSGQVISGRTHLVVHRAGVYPGVASERYVVRAGEEARAHLILVDTQGRVVPNAEVTFIALRERWRSVRKQDADGVFRWVSEVEETPVYAETVRLDNEGKGTVSFTPGEGGSYRLRVIARDGQGREARASVFLWVSSPTYVSWRRENNDRLFLVADKSTYRVGETARVLIPSPFMGPVEALVTLERGTIRKVWRVTLQTNSDIIEVPITADMAPNVFLSVVLVTGAESPEGEPSFKLGYAELGVDVTAQALNVAITPEHDRYRPRDTARFTLQVTDQEGNPVDAEVAVALVDKAVLTLFEQPTPLVQVFYRQRGLGVTTAASLVVNVNRLLRQERLGGKGGGGGAGAEGPTVREEFLDVAYWRPDLRTGPQGRAVIQTPLPDNLTTWTLLTWAVDAQTRLGQAEADILVTQDFLLRPVLPRFFTVGDEARVGVVAHNLSESPLRARVTMTLTGATLVGEPTQEVMLAPGQSEKLTWTVTGVRVVPGDTGMIVTATWTGTTDVAGVGDAVRITLPVRYPAPPEVTATAGVVTPNESRLEVVVLPPGRVPEYGTLTLDLDASLASSMVDSLTYLRHFPWECAEQLSSRFLANVVTWRALKQLGVSNPELEKALPDLIAVAVQRLAQQQNPDGGWGWWARDKSHSFLTAYALWALTEADRAGFTVDPEMMNRAVNFLNRYLQRFQPGHERWRNNRAAMAAFALLTYRAYRGEHPQAVFSPAVRLFQAREKMDIYARGLLGLTFGLLADVSQDEKARQAAREYLDTLLSEIEQAAVTAPTGVHWEEEGVDWWNMNNDIRTTAIILLLMARYDPENPLAPRAVRWLMAARKGDRWTHTQDTAWSVVALTDWMVWTGELHPDYDYAAWLNGTVWLSGTMTPADVGVTQTATVSIAGLRPHAPNWVQIARQRSGDQSGEGALYYRLVLTTFRPLEDVQPESRGITVQRWYTSGDSDTPITHARVGDLVTVHLRVVAARTLQYLVLEDPLPAGVEPVDVRLLTASREAQGPRAQRVPEGERPSWWRWWYWEPTHSELRDDRGAFFQTYMYPGTYEITYQVRASIPGRFVVGPATASQMYAPEVFGRTETTVFRVEE